MRSNSSLGRRELLGGVSGTVLGSVVAGCLTRRGDRDYRIASVEGLNRSRERHEVTVRVSAGGETVYSDTHGLAGSSAGSVDGFLIDEALPDDERPYTVEARLDEGEWTTTHSPDNVDVDCVELLYLVEQPGSRASDGFSAFVSSCDDGD